MAAKPLKLNADLVPDVLEGEEVVITAQAFFLWAIFILKYSL